MNVLLHERQIVLRNRHVESTWNSTHTKERFTVLSSKLVYNFAYADYRMDETESPEKEEQCSAVI